MLGGDELMLSMLLKFGIDTKWEMLAFVMILIFLLAFPFEWIEIRTSSARTKATPCSASSTRSGRSTAT